MHNFTVLIKFSSENPDITVYPERRLTLSETDNTVSIGRSSKDSSKDLVAHHTNAYFDCRVMSRKHAEIVVDTQTKASCVVLSVPGLKLAQLLT